MNQQTLDFIRQHADDDVRQLALRAPRTGDVDLPFALQQIAGRQKARQKLPSWAVVEGLIYPPHLSMEQCSSEQTARYKAALAARLLDGQQQRSMADLTGGFGVDFSFLAKQFPKAVYVERQEHLCDAARHNFQLLGIPHAEVVCGDGVDYLRQMQPVHLIYIDPARRDEHGQRTFGMADCTPDVVAISDEIAKKCHFCMLKLSPMLDWHQAVAELRATGCWSVAEVHIVSVGNECKELLLVLSRESSEEFRLFCVNNDDVFEVNGNLLYGDLPVSDPSRLSSPDSLFLYEPNASIMRAGWFGAVAERFGVQPVGKNSHLFVSPHFIGDFPGRQFEIVRATTMNKRELKAALSGIDSANIAVRNFPLSVAELRKRLHLKDGGDTYIFATTAGEKDHLLLICRKMN